MLNRTRIWATVLAVGICLVSSVSAGVFGEVAVAAGGTWPQGDFTRYADVGFQLSGRATIHIPHVELFSGWVGFSFSQFSRDTRSTTAYIPGGPSVPVDQTTSESAVSGFIGIQVSTITQRAVFRPRAAIGLGVYGFTTTTAWTFDTQDTTIELDSQRDDSQTCLGWHGMIGSDFFVTTNVGISADFIYDHVLGLNQTETPLPKDQADLTSRFLGFSVGVVYMFSS